MAYIFLIIHLVLILYFLFYHPGFILAYLFFFFQITQVIFSDIGVDQLRFFVFLMVLMIYVFLYHKEGLKISKIQYSLSHPLFVGIVIILTGMLFHYLIIGIDNELGRDIVQRFFIQNLPLIVLAAIILYDRKHMEDVGLGIIVFGFLYFLVLIFVGNIHSLNLDDRFGIRELTNINPIMIGRTFGMVCLVSVIYYYHSDNWLIKYVCIISFTLSIYMMFFSASRGPILAVAISLITYLLIKSNNLVYVLKIFGVLSIITLLSYTILTLFDFTILDRLKNLQNYENMRRYQRLIIVAAIFYDVLGLGLGPGGFDVLTGSGWVHNLILEMILEYGFFGILSVGIIIPAGFYLTFKIIKSDKFDYRIEIFAVLWLMFFLAAMVSSHITGNREFWFLTGMFVTISYLLKVPSDRFVKMKKFQDQFHILVTLKRLSN